MSLRGKSINLYLMDGSASGRWRATLSNWNGVAYKIPRGVLKNCSDIPEINSPGVYFLFGKDDDRGKPFIYVGEADAVQKRLLQTHNFEKDGSYWTEAVIFVTPDGTLEKGRVKYLENRFFMIARKIKRYILKNGNTPPQSPMSKQIRDLLEEFIINVRLMLPAMGHMTFEPLPSKDTADPGNELLHFIRNKGKGGCALGKVTADGFWVLKGSYIYPKVASYTASGIKNARLQYADSIDKQGILQEDICFGSPSYAAAFVCGKNSNGLIEWKNKNGIPLKKIDSNEDSAVSAREYALPANNKIDAEILHIAGKKVSAAGQIRGDGFIVHKGSGFCPVETKSCQLGIKRLRAQLVAAGKIKDRTFMEDVYFKSPSAAAACITGGSANGNMMWRYPDGQSIKEKSAIKD